MLNRQVAHVRRQLTGLIYGEKSCQLRQCYQLLNRLQRGRK